MIRLAHVDDVPQIIAVAQASGLFESEQTEEVAQMLDSYFKSEENQEKWLVDDDHGVIGIAYVAPERMTEGTWNLYLIAVHPDHQKKGHGCTLLRSVEQLLSKLGERILLVETSGTEDFEYVRSFYRKNDYVEEARIREFYSAGDDKVIFRKALK